ncbi:MAG: sugar-binding protein, partial [Verrucomicrobiota bacterium]
IPANTATITLTPVATGAGHAAFDNVRLTYYDGTHYATEARRRTTPVQVDGHLDDWSLDRPVPLLADNQLAVHDPAAYAWTPANLSGAAWFTWDDDGLYLAARVRDDLHRPLGADALLDQGDSLILAIHPENRAPGADARAFAYVVSAAPPLVGGGSHTLYRPIGYAGGNSSGHLARDSSVYNLAVRRADGFTTYELFMPWDELGGRFGAGDKLGLSLTLHDNDGGDARAASMSWGEGNLPGWDPTRFGVLTLIDSQ